MRIVGTKEFVKDQKGFLLIRKGLLKVVEEVVGHCNAVVSACRLDARIAPVLEDVFEHLEIAIQEVLVSGLLQERMKILVDDALETVRRSSDHVGEVDGTLKVAQRRVLLAAVAVKQAQETLRCGGCVVSQIINFNNEKRKRKQKRKRKRTDVIGDQGGMIEAEGALFDDDRLLEVGDGRRPVLLERVIDSGVSVD